MTRDFEVADGLRFEVDSRGQPIYKSPFPKSWGPPPADGEQRTRWIKQSIAGRGGRRSDGREVLTRSVPEQRTVPEERREYTLPTEGPRPFDGVTDLTPRYENLTLKEFTDRFKTFELETLALARLRHDGPSAGGELDLEFRALTSPQARAAYGLTCQGRAICPLSIDGKPLEVATMDFRQLLAWWGPGGLHELAWPGVPCQPGTLYALSIWGDSGSAWWRDVSIERQPTRADRLAAWLSNPPDRIDELGVPGEGDPWDEDEAKPRPPSQRAILNGYLRLIEHRPVHAAPQRVVGEAFTGSLRGRSAQAAMLAAKGTLPMTQRWMVWSWPADLKLPVGHLRDGVSTVAALPAENSLMTMGGANWKCQQFPPMTSAPPDWLISELQKFDGEGS